MKKYVVMVCITCLILCSTSQAAIYIPDFSTTYIPPSVESMMDIIYNTYGVTAPNLPTGKLQAYLTLYSGVLGSAYDKFYEDLQKAFNGAKTSGKLVIDSDLSAQLQKGMYNALVNGIPTGESYQVSTNAQGWADRLKDQYNITCDLSILQALYSASVNVGNNPPILLFNMRTRNSVLVIDLLTVNYNTYPNATISKIGEFYRVSNNGEMCSGVCHYTYEFNAVTRSLVGPRLEDAWGGYGQRESVESGNTGVYVDSTPVQAQIGVQEKLSTQSLEVITADTVVDNGVIDDTRPIVITMPNITIYPSITIDGIDNVQDDIGAKPYIDGDVAQAVSDLQNQQSVEYGDIYAYAIDLTEYFPFCIPFDIAHALSLFVAEPQAPNFEFQLPIGYDTQEGVLWDDYSLDLSIFDDVAFWCRRFELLAFIVGLASVTRQLYLRG